VHPDDSMLRHIRLHPNERLLWADRPQQGVVLRARDAVLVPLGLLWAGAVVLWVIQSWRGHAALGVLGLGVVALLPGLWLGAGRLFADRRVRAVTMYGITDRRVVEVRQGLRPAIWSVPIADVEPVDLTVHRDGSATIDYGPMTGPERDLRLLPAASTWWPELRPRLEMVPNGRWVYELLCETAGAPAEEPAVHWPSHARGRIRTQPSVSST